MEKSSFKIWFFTFFLLFIIVGGYILMQQSYSLVNKSTNDTLEEVKKPNVDIRIDKEKDYIYFTDTQIIVEDFDLEYKNIIINFVNGQSIAKMLNDETEALKSSVIYNKESEFELYNDLERASFKRYEVYSFENYLSLVVKYFDYDYENSITYKDSKTYVFEKDTGKLLNQDEILNKYNISKIDVFDKVKVYIEDQGLLVKEEQVLDAYASIELLDDLPLFIDKLGRLAISIIVKSDQKDYNDIVLLS